MKHSASCGCIKVKPQVAERERERGGKLKEMGKGGWAWQLLTNCCWLR